MRFRAGSVFLCSLLIAHAALCADTPVIITVTPTTAQTFAGFGTSLLNTGGTFQQLPASAQRHLVNMLWPGCNFKILRLWFSPSAYWANPSSPDWSDFKHAYIDSGLITMAQAQGCTQLLLAPDDVPASFGGKPGSSGFATFSNAGVSEYAKLLATFVKQLQNSTGVTITTTGVLNEPNDRPIRFTDAQWPVMIKSLRSELDARGLTHTAVIGPEAASCDSTAVQMIQDIRSDALAWQNLSGIATHTYNMGASSAMLPYVTGTNKSYWQTESSSPGPQSPTDPLPAAAAAGRIVSDLNHHVTQWVWFLGFEQADPQDNGTRLISYDTTKSGGAITPFSPYFAMKQLSQAIPPGSVIRPCTSSTGGSMTWTYGTKPAVIATAAQTPGGNFSVALVNYTSNTFATMDEWDRSQGGQPAKSYSVTVVIPELLRSNRTFHVTRTNGSGTETDQGEITSAHGAMTVTLPAAGVITLTTAPNPDVRGGPHH